MRKEHFFESVKRVFELYHAPHHNHTYRFQWDILNPDHVVEVSFNNAKGEIIIFSTADESSAQMKGARDLRLVEQGERLLARWGDELGVYVGVNDAKNLMREHFLHLDRLVPPEIYRLILVALADGQPLRWLNASLKEMPPVVV